MQPESVAASVFLDRLRADPQHLDSLMGLGSIALATGRRDAARTLFGQAIRHHPGALGAWVTLGNMALEDGEVPTARRHYEAALARNADCAEAAQGMARTLAMLGEHGAAERFWSVGFVGHAVSPRRYRGTGAAREVLYLASARGGNVRLWPWLDDDRVAVTVIYADYADLSLPLPRHDWIINAIGDAEGAAAALANAEGLISTTTKPVINHPTRIRQTGRSDLGRLCEGVEGLVAPRIRSMQRAAILSAEDLEFPLLVRAPGFHTGQHFHLVRTRAALACAVQSMPGEAFFVIQPWDARGPDGMTRKYRIMLVGGRIYPWHLAISSDWKVHYFTAAMAEQEGCRAEEHRFLTDASGVLGKRAMTALERLGQRMGLEYAGVDFALAPDGSVLVFEANATMTINAPPPGAIWDYR
jgi:tetratricopeptide (TPR) repeat protein